MSPQRLRALQKHWQGPAAGAWEQEQGWCQKGQGQHRNSDVTERLMEPEQIFLQLKATSYSSALC